MKTIALLIPRESFNEIRAIIETTWKVTRQSTFTQAIKEYATDINGLFSLEIHHHRQTTTFYVTAQEEAINTISNSLYTIFPDIQISEQPDFTRIEAKDWNIATSEMILRDKDIIPLKDASYFQQDSLTALLTTFTKLPYEGHYIVQFVCSALKEGSMLRASLRKDATVSKLSHLLRPKFWIKEKGKETRFTAIDQKINEVLLGVSGRICAMLPQDKEYSRTPADYTKRILKGGYTECFSSSLNKVLLEAPSTGKEALQFVQDREFNKPFRLSAKELSTLWHLPDIEDGTSVNHILSKKNSIPKSAFPTEDCSIFAENSFRQKTTLFGLQRDTRQHHTYLVGQTGTGKSKLFELLAKSDLHQNKGMAVIDPHGDLVDDILKYVPESRIEDVVLIDPANNEFPVSFNPVAQVPEKYHAKVITTLTDCFRKVLTNKWSDSMERLVSKCIETILLIDGGTLETFLKILSSPNYRKSAVRHIKKKELLQYWQEEFPGLLETNDELVIAPIISFLGELLASDVVHDMLCQPVNRINFKKIIDTNKILLIKLPKGMLGDSCTSLLGSLFLARIYQAAYSQEEKKIQNKDPFNLYVDEFHTFTTISLNEMLTESRRKGLSLTLSNQHVEQVDKDMQNSILNNVGTIIAMKVGGIDAKLLSEVFNGSISPADLTHLATREFVIKTHGTPDAFTGRTLDCYTPAEHFAEECTLASRDRYALPAKDVSDMVKTWSVAA